MVAKRRLREQTNFGQAVEHNPVRLELFNPIEDRPDSLAELQIGRVDHRLLLLRIETELPGGLTQKSGCHPNSPVGLGHGLELLFDSERVM